MVRRDFLKLSAGAGLGLAGFLGSEPFSYGKEPAIISFGIVGDIHYADKETRNNRYYRESLAKLKQCVETFNQSELGFVVMLGDFIDKARDKATELEYLATIREVFSVCQGHKHFVIGNHDLAYLSKAEYLANCGAVAQKSFYSFDAAGCHFVILDANFRQDGEEHEAGNFRWTDTCLPVSQQQWLEQDLARAGKQKAVVFVHQNLHDQSSPYGVKNAKVVRNILEKSGNVLAVIQGHDHKGAYARINGIHYFTLKALVDGPALKNNSYGIVSIEKNNRISMRGFGRQQDVNFSYA
jgi:alkaline phosphatase